MRCRTLQGAASAAALISVLFTRVFGCHAFVVRTAIPGRGCIGRVRRGVAGLRASWIDEQVSLEVPTSSRDAYSVYSDLRRQPEWSPWLKSVEHDRESGTSKWVIQSKGFRVSWRARNTVEVADSEVAWESTTGLSNRGRVTFEERGEDRCLMTLTLSYNLPYVIASVLRLEAVERFVKRTILSDLARFKKILVQQVGEAEANTPAPASTTTVAVEHDSSSASGPSSHGEGDLAVAAAGSPVAAATTTSADAAAEVAGGATLEASAGDTHAVEAVEEDAGVELKGEVGTGHVPGRRRSRWRRRFRRLLRRGDREQDVAVTVVGVEKNDGSRAGVTTGGAAKI